MSDFLKIRLTMTVQYLKAACKVFLRHCTENTRHVALGMREQKEMACKKILWVQWRIMDYNFFTGHKLIRRLSKFKST